jgi:hypothetical protein
LEGYSIVLKVMEYWVPDDCSEYKPFAGTPFWAIKKQRQYHAVFHVDHEQRFQKDHARKHEKRDL